ncbi:hypothetical protein HZS_1131 [Henneguya salminicola]|nr:hypothetical protein HZS_1131 [Henneguya salminicola]
MILFLCLCFFLQVSFEKPQFSFPLNPRSAEAVRMAYGYFKRKNLDVGVESCVNLIGEDNHYCFLYLIIICWQERNEEVLARNKKLGIAFRLDIDEENSVNNFQELCQYCLKGHSVPANVFNYS